MVEYICAQIWRHFMPARTDKLAAEIYRQSDGGRYNVDVAYSTKVPGLTKFRFVTEDDIEVNVEYSPSNHKRFVAAGYDFTHYVDYLMAKATDGLNEHRDARPPLVLNTAAARH